MKAVSTSCRPHLDGTSIIYCDKTTPHHLRSMTAALEHSDFAGNIVFHHPTGAYLTLRPAVLCEQVLHVTARPCLQEGKCHHVHRAD